MKNKLLKELEAELEALREAHKDIRKEYGSELCAGDMVRKENALKARIAKLKKNKKQ